MWTKREKEKEHETIELVFLHFEPQVIHLSPFLGGTRVTVWVRNGNPIMNPRFIIFQVLFFIFYLFFIFVVFCFFTKLLKNPGLIANYAL